MIVLFAFAILAGAGTALSPCVLPVLPALLSAGSVGGRRRPLGIVIGLSITFTVTIVGLANVVDGVGLGSDPLRDVSIAVLLVFGLALLAPEVSARMEAPLSRLARFGPRSTGDGFRSGLLVGGALGFVYTPCASPILAAVISVSAATGRTIALALAYSLGSAAVLLVLSLGGRKLLERVRRAGRGPTLQRVLGTIMILTAVAILTNLDVNFDQFVAEHIPNVNLTSALECSSTVTGRLHEITGRRAKFKAANGSSSCGGSSSETACAGAQREPGDLSPTRAAARPRRRARIHRHPGLVQHPRQPPLSLAWLRRPRRARRLLDLHLHQLHPHAPLPEGVGREATASDGLDDRRRGDAGVRLRARGVQRADAIEQFGIHYPVVQDNN